MTLTRQKWGPYPQKHEKIDFFGIFPNFAKDRAKNAKKSIFSTKNPLKTPKIPKNGENRPSRKSQNLIKRAANPENSPEPPKSTPRKPENLIKRAAIPKMAF